MNVGFLEGLFQICFLNVVADLIVALNHYLFFTFFNFFCFINI